MIILIMATASLVIVGLLLIGVVLLQNPKDEGGVNSFGTGMQQIIGVAHVPNVLEKITYSLGALLLSLALLTSFVIKQKANEKIQTSPILAQLESYASKKPINQEN